jgi:hypothetical protein
MAGERGRKEEDERPTPHGRRRVDWTMLALCRPPGISMMQAANFGNWHNDANIGRLDRPYVGRILLQREVSARAVIMGKVAGQETVKVPLAENEHVVQTLAPDRADEPLHERVLPRAVSRREHFEDPHAHEALPEGVAVERVAIAEEGGGRGVVRERLHDLLGGPGCGRSRAASALVRLRLRRRG